MVFHPSIKRAVTTRVDETNPLYPLSYKSMNDGLGGIRTRDLEIKDL
jgi:hypothetical protein